MKRFSRKGQAALEFLTTYGWAFLVILVMIGALAYFGVLSPDRFVTDRCKLDGMIDCNSIALTNSTIAMNIKNNLDKPIQITKIEVKEAGAAAYLSSTNTSATIAAYNSGDWTGPALSGVLSDASGAGLGKGDKKKFNLIVYYTVGSSAIEKASSGDAVTTLQ